MNKSPKYLTPFVLLLSLLFSLGAMSVDPGTNAGNEPTAASAKAADGRTIMLGFDGADARTVRDLMAAYPGEYPTFEKLSQEGTFETLIGVAPPESPVSWAAINTGQNPAKTGVPGFVKRTFHSTGYPMAGFGHIVAGEKQTLEEIAEVNGESHDHGAGKAGMERSLIAGLGLFLVVFILLKMLKQNMVVAMIASLIVGGGGGFFLGKQHADALRADYPEKFPVTLNPLKVDNFWDHAAKQGVETVILDAAQAFGKDAPDGARVLSGLGVPDAKGGLGDWCIYTSDEAELEKLGKKIKKSFPTEADIAEGRSTKTSGTVFYREMEAGVMRTKLYGPVNFWEKEALDANYKLWYDKVQAGKFKDVKESIHAQQEKDRFSKARQEAKKLNVGYTSVDLVIEAQGTGAKVTLDGDSADLEVGQWSDFLSLNFKLNESLQVKAVTRVRLVSMEPHVELFVDVLGIDPREPPFWQPISSPSSFASELATDCGVFETYGWPTLTMPLKDSEIDSELLMEDVENTMRWRETLTHSVLDQDDWKLFMSVFSTTDRVQHMMYKYYDETHPQYVAEEAAREMVFFGETIKLSEAIPAVYKQMDRIIGEVLAKLNPEDTLMVCSDHGFQSFKREVHVNNWLVENGYMTLNTNFKSVSSFGYVNWAKTRVYSLGMGFLYVNLKGREPMGIVDPSEVDALFVELREKLLATKDEGVSIAKHLYILKDEHNGPYLHEESDAIIGFAATHHVSWKSTGGSIAMKPRVNNPSMGGKRYTGEMKPTYQDNESPWSGCHISVSLDDVGGVFFCNKKVEVPSDGVFALQLAPTILEQVGVQVPAEMDLKPLKIQ